MEPRKRAVAYVRQSRERESTLSPEVQRQRTADYAAAQGWDLVATFEDVGVSGYSPRARREGFEALQAYVAEEGADVVLVYRLDRLTRRGVLEALRVVEFLDAHGCALASVSEAFLDTSTALGKGIFGMFAALAEQESENISARTTGAKAATRRPGAWSWNGGTAPYGFRASTERTEDGTRWVALRAVPHEAQALQEAASRILSGESLGRAADALNAAGRLGRRGALWDHSALRRRLESPVLAGYAARLPSSDGHARPEPVYGPDGRPVETGWDVILEPADWRRLTAALRSRPPRRPSTSRALLAGLVACGTCGSVMRANRSSGRGGAYRCASRACPRSASASLPVVDDFVARAVWRHVAALDPADEADSHLLLTASGRHASRSPSAVAQRASLDEARERLTAASEHSARVDRMMAAGFYDGREEVGVAAAREATLAVGQAAAEVEALEAAVGRSASASHAGGGLGVPWLDVVQALDVPAGDPLGPGGPWGEWEVEERRAFLSLFLDRVEVSPSATGRGKGRHTREEEVTRRLRLVWAGGTGLDQ